MAQGFGIHDLIHYSNIKALASSTDDATLEHLECAPGLSHVLGYLIIYCCHLLQGQLLKSEQKDLISKFFVIFACGGPEN